MTVHVTFTEAHARLAALCDRVAENREVVVIQRRGAADVALVSAAGLHGLLETAHLLRSSENAERLHRALTRARREETAPQALDELRREVGLAPRC